MAKSYITTGRVAENRKARHEYEIEDRVEAGLVLMGSEVKSLRTGRASIAESYAGEDNGRLMLFNANLPSYEAARVNHEPRRPRELLVKVRERNRLLGLIRREGSAQPALGCVAGITQCIGTQGCEIYGYVSGRVLHCDGLAFAFW